MDKIGFKDPILKSENLPDPQSNRGPKASVILQTFITSICCGANRYMHTKVTRHGLILGKIFDMKSTSAQDTHKRLFNKLDQTANQKVSDCLYF